MRALVVGLGSIGRRHARNWAALGYGPLAVCRQRRTLQPEPLGVEVTEYDDLDGALGTERPDVVFVTNPTSLHVATACRAVAAGAHVFVEKPLGCGLEGVAALIEAAEARERQVMVGYNLRFHPGLVRLKALLAQNVIGRLVSARAEVGEYLPDWHPWEDYRQSYSGRRELGGGAILTFSHELDALCWLIGAPRRLTAMAAHASSLEIDTEDVAEILIEFESGALGSVHVDYVRRPARRSIELTGEQGVLHWDYASNRLELYSVATGQWRIEAGEPHYARNQMYRDELRQFAACVWGEPPGPLCDARQGAGVLAVALAALGSAAEGRAVDFRAAQPEVREWLAGLGAAAHG